MDVTGIHDPEQIMRMDLPFVMDLIKAKVRLENAKTEAQKKAEALAALQNGKK